MDYLLIVYVFVLEVMIFASTGFSLNISLSTDLSKQLNLIQKHDEDIAKLFNLSVSLAKHVTELHQENDALKLNVTAMAARVKLYEEFQSTITGSLERNITKLHQEDRVLKLNFTGMFETLKLHEEVQSNFTRTNDKLENELFELKQENAVLKRNITVMCETNALHEQVQNNLTRNNVRLEKELLDLKQRIDSNFLVAWDTMGNLSSIRNELSGLDGSLTSLQQSMVTFRDDLTFLHNEHVHLSEKFNYAQSVVAFTAINTDAKLNLADNEVIIFNKMITRVGGEYNPETGIFTAKLNGFYAFFVNIRAYPSTIKCWIDIVKNGDSVGTIFLDSNGLISGDSTLAIASLIIGDKVWIRKSKYVAMNLCSLDNHNTFTGFLIPTN